MRKDARGGARKFTMSNVREEKRSSQLYGDVEEREVRKKKEIKKKKTQVATRVGQASEGPRDFGLQEREGKNLRNKGVHWI